MIAVLLALTLAAPAAPTAPVVIDGVDVTGWTTQQLWEQADTYFHAGDYPKAVHLHQRIVALDPTDTEAYAVAAWLVWSMGDEPSARRWLQRSVERNPNAWDSHWELGYHLLDRCGDAAAAVPELEEALRHPPYPDNVPRTLAHAYLYAERPTLAVALWDKLQADRQVPAGIYDTNRPQAIAMALRSDLLARDGGVVSGPLDPAALPVVVADRRQGDARTLDLADPARPKVPLFRITYRLRKVIYKPVWDWVSMATDLSGRGGFAHAPQLNDPDGDGIAESLPPIAALRAQRGAQPPLIRRFVSPDRYEVGADSRGQRVPLVPAVAAGELTLAPPVVIASDERDLTLRLRLVETTRHNGGAAVSVPLPPGVYCAEDEPTAPHPRLAVAAEGVPAGRYVIVVEVLVRGAVMDRKLAPTVALREAAGWRLEPAQPGDITDLELLPLRGAGEATGPAGKVGHGERVGAAARG